MGTEPIPFRHGSLQRDLFGMAVRSVSMVRKRRKGNCQKAKHQEQTRPKTTFHSLPPQFSLGTYGFSPRLSEYMLRVRRRSINLLWRIGPPFRLAAAFHFSLFPAGRAA